MKDINPAPAKRTKEQVRKDAEKARESHRRGHGHHRKRFKKAAKPIASDGDGNIVEVRLDQWWTQGRMRVGWG